MTAMLTRAGENARWVNVKDDGHLIEHARTGRSLRGRQLVFLLLESRVAEDRGPDGGGVLFDTSGSDRVGEQRPAGLSDEVEHYPGRAVRRSEEQKRAVAKLFAKINEPNVVAAPVAPKAKQAAAKPNEESKGKGRGRSQSREPHEGSKKTPRWHFHVGSGCSHGDKCRYLHTATISEEVETVKQHKASPTQPVAKQRDASKSRAPKGGTSGMFGPQRKWNALVRGPL
jgi:hypothetical protein